MIEFNLWHSGFAPQQPHTLKVPDFNFNQQFEAIDTFDRCVSCSNHFLICS